jgi:predicted nucleic acid-binding protein
MKKYFVDSNVFLRFLTKDDPNHARAAEKLFLAAKNGEVELYCGPPVLFEIAWVLRSFYKVPPADVLDTLEAIIAIPNLKILDADLVSGAIALAREKECGFADSYIALTARKKGLEMATFNTRHFKKLEVGLYSFSPE